ncbi:protein of unknown function (plasmid) [Cupriavidus taiwanensis]|uniref:Uncharacterized protein n=1 Tax=Cupriavidus taiwanensis TaxID=164546 RepID=A0A375EDN0_9BURK|nr:protein of unknown function [Cupriavidus taiwanensis]SOZ72505.1 protein of unknown function [Cupriavidus taiwanensis]SOZ74959.1 protein of unknown function [Cupriavidus taiwanensis]SPA11734.1 protein of unknown function [Cupriavidus taiwanensis]
MGDCVRCIRESLHSWSRPKYSLIDCRATSNGCCSSGRIFHCTLFTSKFASASITATPTAIPQPEGSTGRHRYGTHADTPDVPTLSEAGQKDYAMTKLICLGQAQGNLAKADR